MHEQRDAEQHAPHRTHARRFRCPAALHGVSHTGAHAAGQATARRHTRQRRLDSRVAMRAPAGYGKSAVEERSEGIQYNIHVRSLHQALKPRRLPPLARSSGSKSRPDAVTPHAPMLDTLTTRMARVVKTLRGEARLTEANTQEMLREVRLALSRPTSRCRSCANLSRR